MKFITEALITPLRSLTGACRDALRCVLLHLWRVFSAPAPAGRDVLTQLLLCLALSAVTGGLLHHWLHSTLTYGHEASAWATCFYGVAVFLASFLCHPVRCVLTMTLPTACTAQGRRYLVSLSVMVVVLKVVPNIMVNAGAVVHVLNCTAEGFTKTLLNSSGPFNMAKQAVVKEAIKATAGSSIVANLNRLDRFTHVDVSAVTGRFAELVGQIEVSLAHSRVLLQRCKLLSNRILAGIFVALLVFESTRYLKSYLTSAEFNDSDRSAWRQQSETPAKRKTNPVCGITRRECTSVFLTLVVVTLHFMAITVMVALDFVVYHIVEMILPWLLDFPPTSAGISVDYEVQIFVSAICIIPAHCTTRELTKFHRDYEWSFSPETSLCNVTTSAPSSGVPLLLGCLWLLCCCLVFLEVCATRLRRSISASFFRHLEERKQRKQQHKDAFQLSPE